MPKLSFQSLEIRKGVHISKDDIKPYGCIVVRPNSLFVDHFTGNTCISSEHIIATNKGSKEDYLRKGEVLIVATGIVGKCYPIRKNFPIPVIANQLFVILKSNKKINLLRLFEDVQFVEKLNSSLIKISEGTAVKRINLEKLKNLSFEW